MANTTGMTYTGGLRGGSIFALNAAGRIKGTSVSVPYMGVKIVGGKVLNLSTPKQRRLNHVDGDRLAAADFLPPTEAASASFNLSADSMVMDAILTGNKTRVIGEAT